MKVIVVDKNDNILAVKDTSDLKLEDIYRVSALWLTNSAGQILLAQRKLTEEHDPGKWGPAVSGTLEEGETYGSNIYKESEEEIGLKSFKFSPGPKVLNDSHYTFFVQWFLCTVDLPLVKFKIQKDEVEKLEWIDKKYLIQDLKNESSKYIAGAEKVWRDFLV